MCGRYAQYAPLTLTDDQRSALDRIDPELDLEMTLNSREPQYNIAPTQKAPVLVRGGSRPP
jgi:putative SOS response-associated peptidase YedK